MRQKMRISKEEMRTYFKQPRHIAHLKPFTGSMAKQLDHNTVPVAIVIRFESNHLLKNRTNLMRMKLLRILSI